MHQPNALKSKWIWEQVPLIAQTAWYVAAEQGLVDATDSAQCRRLSWVLMDAIYTALRVIAADDFPDTPPTFTQGDDSGPRSGYPAISGREAGQNAPGHFT